MGIVRFGRLVAVEFGDGGFDRCRHLVVGRNESANLGRVSLTGIVGYGERCRCASKRIPDDVVVAARAEQKPIVGTWMSLRRLSSIHVT